jgi:hypothetical protein
MTVSREHTSLYYLFFTQRLQYPARNPGTLGVLLVRTPRRRSGAWIFPDRRGSLLNLP